MKRLKELTLLVSNETETGRMWQARRTADGWLQPLPNPPFLIFPELKR